MNNNRNQNNNRRRGRGNRNPGGGGNQGNRIDSRARGNAPQLLDKYKKLAEDAHRNGDRVQAEYYLQFADHYFRVIADNRTRQDDQRGDQRGDQRSGRRDERDQDDFEVEDEGDSRFEIRDRDTRDRESRDRDTRRERPRRDIRRDEQVDEDGVVEASEGPSFEPDENPFTREPRVAREPRETREPREAREPREDRPKRRAPRARRDEDDAPGIDAAALPPSFLANDTASAEEAPAPRPRRKRGDGGTLSAVG